MPPDRCVGDFGLGLYDIFNVYIYMKIIFVVLALCCKINLLSPSATLMILFFLQTYYKNANKNMK
jgi:hypothetical protein